MAKEDAGRCGMERVACDVCLGEIPRSGAMASEATKHVVDFRGLECCEKWKAQLAERAQRSAGRCT